VTLLERTPTAYSFTLVMRPEETPDRTSLQNAVLAVKPAGIVANFVWTDAFIYSEAIHTFSADTMSYDATASTQP
jgi:hypothetical protein